MAEWREVPGWEGYEVSDEGGVRSSVGRGLGDKRAKALQTRWNGYKCVDLYRNGERKNVTVHSIVAEAFIGPRPDGYEVNHKNGIKDDNSPSNLEYVTKSQNAIHALKTGLSSDYKNQPQGEYHPNSVLTEEDVVRIKDLIDQGFDCVRISKQFGVTPQAIYSIKNGRTWRHVT